MATIPQQKKKTTLDIEVKAADMTDHDIVSLDHFSRPLPNK